MRREQKSVNEKERFCENQGSGGVGFPAAIEFPSSPHRLLNRCCICSYGTTFSSHHRVGGLDGDITSVGSD